MHGVADRPDDCGDLVLDQISVPWMRMFLFPRTNSQNTVEVNGLHKTSASLLSSHKSVLLFDIVW